MESTISNPALYTIPKISIAYSLKTKASERPSVKSSFDCYNVLKQVWDFDMIELVEDFKVILLNRAKRVLGIYEQSRGGISATIADPRLTLGVAITAAASSLILAHSHPSGNLVPSKEDELLTKKMKAGAALFDIAIYDHIIITKESYFSFADSGVL